MPMITRLAVFALLATLALPARAQTVYVVTTAYHDRSTAFSFGTLTLQTGAFHAIATNKRYENVRALGFGANGRLYALRLNLSSAVMAMDEYRVDTTTGDMTLQKKFANTFILCAGADSKGVFTGFLYDTSIGVVRLFTLDPAAQSLQVGALTLVQPTGLVVADSLGNVYTDSGFEGDFGKAKLSKVINVHTGAAVLLGATGLRHTGSGFLFHGLLYVLGEDVYSIRTGGSRPGPFHLPGTDIYTLNLATGAANFVIRSTLPDNARVMAAALAPNAEAAANSPAMRGKGNAHQ